MAVFQAGQHEDDIAGNSTWETGDWSGDGDFDSRDLVLAFQDGGYEQAASAASMPEPASWILGLTSLVCLIARHRRARS